MIDYARYIYNENVRPKTGYPSKLINYLIERLDIPTETEVLDLGCGRGDFAQAFLSSGMKVSAVDQSDWVTENYENIDFKKCDFTKENLPYKDNSFGVVFSKSVIEHLYYPETLFSEAKRILKPGGLLITMCPSWEHNHRTYFEDFTHRTPFMKVSLHDFNILLGFEHVETEFFKQLPFVWNSKIGYFLSEFIRYLPVNFMKKKSKLVRFSKETMLLSIATKNEK